MTNQDILSKLEKHRSELEKDFPEWEDIYRMYSNSKDDNIDGLIEKKLGKDRYANLIAKVNKL
jgi:hypothetical protein